MRFRSLRRSQSSESLLRTKHISSLRRFNNDHPCPPTNPRRRTNLHLLRCYLSKHFSFSQTSQDVGRIFLRLRMRSLRRRLAHVSRNSATTRGLDLQKQSNRSRRENQAVPATTHEKQVRRRSCEKYHRQFVFRC